MRAPENSESGTPPPPNNASTVILMLGDIANTTWRMFVPTLGGTGLGLWADKTWRTSPWLSLSGLTVGIIITVVLMKHQFRNVKNS